MLSSGDLVRIIKPTKWDAEKGWFNITPEMVGQVAKVYMSAEEYLKDLTTATTAPAPRHKLAALIHFPPSSSDGLCCWVGPQHIEPVFYV